MSGAVPCHADGVLVGRRENERAFKGEARWESNPENQNRRDLMMVRKWSIVA